MQKKAICILTFLLTLLSIFPLQAGIGDWKAYMAYYDVKEVEQAGNNVFVLASNNLYVYNLTDKSIQTFSKTNYLSSCNIQHIAYNKSTKRLLILYSNANIDFMNANNYEVHNLADYYNSNITSDKTVTDIYMNGKYAYLSNGFGILKINMETREISETYQLGFKVEWCEIKNNYIYAYSQSNGQYRASLKVNLQDKNNWEKIGGYIAKTEEDKTELKQLANSLKPGGPKYNYFGFIKYLNGKLYTCGGGWNTDDLERKGCIQVLKEDDDWQIYQDDIASQTGYLYKDIDCLDVDPKDEGHVFAGGLTGMYEFKDGNFVAAYTNDNSNNILQTASTVPNNKDKNYVIVNTLKYDNKGNLWGFNSISPTTSLFSYDNSKKWNNFHKSDFVLTTTEYTDIRKNTSLENAVNMRLDSRGLLWFCNYHWRKPILCCYNIENDALKTFNTFTNQDGTKIDCHPREIVEDKNGDLWLGTTAGPLLLESNQINSDNPVFTQIKVPRNDGTNYADYLLSGVNISCIAIDTGNRKWFGTDDNGIYVISADNLTQIHHFTAINSPLLSNQIESIDINPTSGEVYIGTNQGLCSYQSDASAINSEMNKDNVWAYPNPVRPDYTGIITIIGLSYNADIKIVSTNGSLVNQGKSNGGTYTWDGCDLKGKKVASGIYMVETATSDGSKGTVCKIAIVR